MTYSKETHYEEWSKILWKSWNNPSDDSGYKSASELLKIFQNNAFTTGIKYSIQGSETEFFQYLMKEFEWDQALLLAYIDFENMHEYLHDICRIYVEKFVKIGEYAEVLICAYFNSEKGADFLKNSRERHYYLDMALEQLKTKNPQLL